MRTRDEQPRRRAPVRERPTPPRVGLSNHALARVLQRDAIAAVSLDPKKYSTFGDWVAAFPSTAWNENAVDMTSKVRETLPDLADLVDDLRADCADVTILLRHYYLERNGQKAEVPGWDAKAKKRVSYPIGKGVTRKQLRAAVADLGTIHFQERGTKLTIVDWYGGAKPITNLKQLLAAGLRAGDLLVWKKRAGIKGNFSGHVQTIRGFGSVSDWNGDTVRMKPVITVVQGTMENGAAKARSRRRC